MEVALDRTEMCKEQTVGQLLKIIIFGKSDENDAPLLVRIVSRIHEILVTTIVEVGSLICYRTAIHILLLLGVSILI